MLFGCFDEKDMWITQLDRIVMFKTMVDHGLTLDEYKYDFSSSQDWDSSATFYKCMKVFADHYGIQLEDGEKNEHCFRLTFPFDEQCVWGYERTQIEELKTELRENIDSTYNDSLFSEWEGESTLKVTIEGGQDYGRCLNNILNAYEKLKPYMEVRIKNVSDHHIIRHVITTD